VNPLTIVLILLLLAASWWLLHQRRANSAGDAKPNVRPSSANTRFHAVSIKIGNRGCKAAKEMVGRRFLATAAPKLPLPGCDIQDCNCKFAHYQDRRSRRDRRSHFGTSALGGGTGAFETEQRAIKDRRTKDRSDDGADDVKED
jgi:hypothetical protein